MDTSVLAAIIAAAVALISAIITVLGQSRSKKLEHRLLKERESESKEREFAEIVSKYSKPILRSAIDLKRRLESYIVGDGLVTYYNRTERDREYTINNTLFLIAEYFCWVEILYQQIQFLDVGLEEQNQNLNDYLREVNLAFMADINDSNDGVDFPFRIYKGEQRAIGEIMMKNFVNSDNQTLGSIGYAEFLQRLEEPEFSKWFAKFKNDLIKNAKEPHKYDKRLTKIHNALLGLINILDEERKIFPDKERKLGRVDN